LCVVQITRWLLARPKYNKERGITDASR
jgi:hypothetical protein